MPFWKSTSKNTRQLDSFGLATNNSNGGSVSSEFYEMELAVVLDIILDDKHPIFSKNSATNTNIDADRWPVSVDGKAAIPSDIDYTWIGRALVRPVISGAMTNKDQLSWAYPIDNNISEYPLINETVIVVIQGDRLYYTKKLNRSNWPNNNLDFSINKNVSGKDNTELYTNNPYVGKQESVLKAPTKTTLVNNTGYKGYAGKYFAVNHRIRSLKRYEGDLSIESRHGQSIHMTAYDDNRSNDVGIYEDYNSGNGNPMILIRNRQRPLLREGQLLTLNGPNKAPLSGTSQEKNVGGYISENINYDGSSIHITSGQTISGWVSTCYKKMFGTGEEVSKFNGNVQFKYPTLNGDQIVINSDRLILSARYGELFQYSKKRFAIVTDNEYTIDAHQQIVLTTNTKTVINSPAIYLGEYDNTNEPVLLGQTTVNWLYEMCNWLLEHSHVHIHSHVDAGSPSPTTTQYPVQVQRLILLRDKLQTLMSRRVFTTGGGFSSGQNGEQIPNGTDPVKININTGTGIPGGWNGTNYRQS